MSAVAPSAPVAWGKVPLESDRQLAALARLSSSDVNAAKEWVKSFSKSVLVVDLMANGTPKRWLTASLYRQMWEARGV